MPLVQSQYKYEMQGLIDEVIKCTHHPYANKYVNYPDVDLFQLHYNYLFLQSQQCNPERLKAFCVCQILLQLGLDSHDKITVDNVEGDHDIKVRQLTILAGDYFSSYYYYYLAKHGHIDLIQPFSKAIQEINEYKMRLHHSHITLSDQEKKSLYISGKCGLTHAVLDHFDAPDIWYECYRLFLELKYDQQDLVQHNRLKRTNISKLEKTLRQFDQHVQSELKLWLDKILKQEEHLVIEP